MLPAQGQPLVQTSRFELPDPLESTPEALFDKARVTVAMYSSKFVGLAMRMTPSVEFLGMAYPKTVLKAGRTA